MRVVLPLRMKHSGTKLSVIAKHKQILLNLPWPRPSEIGRETDNVEYKFYIPNLIF